MIRLSFFLLLIILMGCGSEKVKVMEEDAFVDIMTDLAYSEVIINLYGPLERDSMRLLLTESLLKIHKLDRAELENNLDIYMRDFELMDRVTQTMLDRYDKVLEETPIPNPIEN